MELQLLQSNPPPDPLPDGWIMHRSKSQNGYCYYFNQFTGECKWDAPYVAPKLSQLEGLKETLASLTELGDLAATSIAHSAGDIAMNIDPESSSSPVKSILKKSHHAESTSLANAATTNADTDNNTTSQSHDTEISPSKKRSHHHDKSSSNSSSKRTKSSSTPEKVRTLHILKKHSGSRRPSSWRQAKITISKEEAIEELSELITILKDVASDPKELRATFEELAKTESDCSSAKRGGDLGFFTRNKMQPNFEKASFALEVGQMSDIVETSSGVHVILRLG